MSGAATIEPAATEAAVQPATRPFEARAFFQLTKPRITFMVVLTTLVGFLEASAAPRDLSLLLQTLLATACVAGAASAFNQIMERRLDGAMQRTRNRPLPSGRLSVSAAILFSLTLLVAGAVWLAIAANLLASALALFTAGSYLLAYTPLKLRTWHATIVGAVPGAIPPMIGWAAATGSLTPGAVALFLIVFFWQMPHFLAIAVLFRDDYARAGFRVLPVIEPDGVSTGRQATAHAVLLLAASLFPFFLGMAGPVYLALASLLGAAFVGASARLVRHAGDVSAARALFRLSLVYLPVVMLLVLVA